MDAVIISIGTELTTGQNIDTNTAWLSAELTKRGATVVAHQTVGDDVGRIQAVIQQALDQAQLVILTGGLGPTPDDLTREALAQAIDQPLEECAEALAQIRSLFERWQRPMPESNRVQALIPRGCQEVPNERGTAPGIHCCREETHLFALPGVPAEMEAMFSSSVDPLLGEALGDLGTREAQLRCFGISEAKVGELLGDLMVRDRNPLVGITASAAVISVRVLGRGVDPTKLERLVAADAGEIRRRLGRAVFGEGDTSLEEAVGGLLTARRLTIATAESCTGGLLAKRLTDVPGSSAYFLRGLVTYSNESKEQLLNVPRELIAEQGAVSEQVAKAMASGCRTSAGSDFALSVTGIAGPSGGSRPTAGGQPSAKPVGLVYFGMAYAGGVRAKRVLFGEHLTRGEIRDRACKTALNLLRLDLLAGETV